MIYSLFHIIEIQLSKLILSINSRNKEIQTIAVVYVSSQDVVIAVGGVNDLKNTAIGMRGFRINMDSGK